MSIKIPAVEFNALLQKFGKNGEKSGWTYAIIPKVKAKAIAGINTIFRVKGKIDEMTIHQVAVLPDGQGNFIIPVNGAMRKQLKKKDGDKIKLALTLDKTEILPDQDFLDCVTEVPKAWEFYNSLPGSHKNWFTKWLATAKTQETKANRIAMAISALSRGLKFNEILKEAKAKKGS